MSQNNKVTTEKEGFKDICNNTLRKIQELNKVLLKKDNINICTSILRNNLFLANIITKKVMYIYWMIVQMKKLMLKMIKNMYLQAEDPNWKKKNFNYRKIIILGQPHLLNNLHKKYNIKTLVVKSNNL
jgi:hypothetical protein